jgi:hypothetical protein
VTSADIVKMELHVHRAIMSCENSEQFGVCLGWITRNRFIPSFLRTEYSRRLKDYAFYTKGLYIHVNIS